MITQYYESNEFSPSSLDSDDVLSSSQKRIRCVRITYNSLNAYFLSFILFYYSLYYYSIEITQAFQNNLLQKGIKPLGWK